MLCSGVGTLSFHGKIPIGVLCPVLGTLIFFSKNPYREKIPVLYGTLSFFCRKNRLCGNVDQEQQFFLSFIEAQELFFSFLGRGEGPTARARPKKETNKVLCLNKT